MWRRPLTTQELDAYHRPLHHQRRPGRWPAGRGEERGAGVLPVAQLPLPLRGRQHAGRGHVTALTDYELASALSYTLWDTAPDQALLDLAAQGKLRDNAVLMEQAKRLLGSVPKISPAMQSFVQQWLHIEDLRSPRRTS
jgi:hypothetical protein